MEGDNYVVLVPSPSALFPAAAATAAAAAAATTTAATAATATAAALVIVFVVVIHDGVRSGDDDLPGLLQSGHPRRRRRPGGTIDGGRRSVDVAHGRPPPLLDRLGDCHRLRIPPRRFLRPPLVDGGRLLVDPLVCLDDGGGG